MGYIILNLLFLTYCCRDGSTRTFQDYKQGTVEALTKVKLHYTLCTEAYWIMYLLLK